MAGYSTPSAARLRARRRAAGVCINGCGRPAQAGRSRCRPCGVAAAATERRRYWLRKFGKPGNTLVTWPALGRVVLDVVLEAREQVDRIYDRGQPKGGSHGV